MVVDFNYATVGLKVTFENLSTRVPSDYTYHWDPLVIIPNLL